MVFRSKKGLMLIDFLRSSKNSTLLRTCLLIIWDWFENEARAIWHEYRSFRLLRKIGLQPLAFEGHVVSIWKAWFSLRSSDKSSYQIMNLKTILAQNIPQGASALLFCKRRWTTTWLPGWWTKRAPQVMESENGIIKKWSLPRRGNVSPTPLLLIVL